MSDSYHIRITPHALADLHSVFEFIRHDSPANASKMIQSLMDAIDSLESFPYRHGTPRGQSTAKPNIRSMVVKPYLVRYRIDEPHRSVFILHVRHAARNY